MTFAVFSFGVQHLVKLISRADSDVSITELNDFYDFTHEFDGGDQVRFAVALGQLTPPDVFVDYSQFGEFKAFYYQWNLTKDSTNFELPQAKLRQCTLDDFNLGNRPQPSTFYKLRTEEEV